MLVGAYEAAMQCLTDANSHGTRTQYLIAIGGASAMFITMRQVFPAPMAVHNLPHAAKLLNDAQSDLVQAGLLPNDVVIFE